MEGSDIRRDYERRDRRKKTALIVALAVIFLAGLYFMTLGTAETDFMTVVSAIRAYFSHTLDSGIEQAAAYKIILHLRLPRLVMAVLAGIGLAASGACMQGITRNPLVSPFTVGISSAAAFGASVAIVFGATSITNNVLIVFSAFLFSLLCAALVYLVAVPAGMSPESIVLIGTAMNYVFSAGSSAMQFFADEHQLSDVVNWTFGSFNGITWEEVGVVAAFVAVCLTLLYFFPMKLNAMSSGDDETVVGLGINPGRVRIAVGLLSILMTAAIISFTGVIGFVGLVAPHIARMLVGNDYRYLIAFSGIVGAALLMISDTIGKVILAPVAIPVGIVVSFLGVPVFINLILTRKRGYFG